MWSAIFGSWHCLLRLSETPLRAVYACLKINKGINASMRHAVEQELLCSRVARLRNHIIIHSCMNN